MPQREAACSCGQLRAVCHGDPVRVSLCHCLACQRRTGSPFGVQAWYPAAQVLTSGGGSPYVRKADSGRTVTFHFCPTCGGTVFWQAEDRPDFIAVAVGAFADPTVEAPGRAVWEVRQHAWTAAIGTLIMTHEERGPGDDPDEAVCL